MQAIRNGQQTIREGDKYRACEFGDGEPTSPGLSAWPACHYGGGHLTS